MRDRTGLRACLREMTRFGWKPIIENGNTIALANDARCSITLEPGGQFELSGAPLETVHQTCDEVHEHLRQVREVCDELGLGMLGLGFDPKWRREDIPWMPKQRYRIMRRLHAEKGPPRPRHDAAHLHRANQPRLPVRGRHGEEIPSQPRAAAGRRGAVRQFAFCRRAAVRVPQLSQPHLDRYRPGPLRYLALCLRAGLRVRALCRLHARCADVFRVPRRKIHRCERPVVPRFHGRQAAGADRTTSRASATGPTI